MNWTGSNRGRRPAKMLGCVRHHGVKYVKTAIGLRSVRHDEVKYVKTIKDLLGLKAISLVWLLGQISDWLGSFSVSPCWASTLSHRVTAGYHPNDIALTCRHFVFFRESFHKAEIFENIQVLYFTSTSCDGRVVKATVRCCTVSWIETDPVQVAKTWLYSGQHSVRGERPLQP